MIDSIYVTYMGLTEPLLDSQALNYLRKLAKKGIHFHILSFEKKEFLKKDKLEKIKKELDEYGIKWSFLTYHKRCQFISKPYDIICGAFVIFYITLKERIDVIHARCTFCALMGIAAKIILHKKMIFDVRGLMAEEYADVGSWSRKSAVYKAANVFEGYFIRHADEVIVLTDKIKKILAGKYPVKNITVIPSCTDLDKFNVNKERNNFFASKYSLGKKFVMVYVGSVGTWYMFPEMVNFYRQITGIFKEAVFIVVSQTKKEIIERHIAGRARESVFIETAEPNAVAEFLNLADAGISFIKPCFSKIASSPTKFGEYLACGLPVLINAGIGDTEEIVRENNVGIVIDDFTDEAYRRGIYALRELLKEGDALSSRCRKVAEKFLSLEKGAERYRQVYSTLDR